MMRIQRFYTKDYADKPGGYLSALMSDKNCPIEMERTDVKITGLDGNIKFEQKNVEFPTSWNYNSKLIVASKYFRGDTISPDREFSIKQLIHRVVQTISSFGVKQGYFDEEAQYIFEDELAYIIANQIAWFNSPVWFNVGINPEPQCSACFILNIEDNMESIIGVADQEAHIFKEGSGTGKNLSKLRSKHERLSGGGKASGVLSFMRVYDSMANIIKAGGKNRRAAKMEILNADHPEIMDFIKAKAHEEEKARVLLDAGYGDPNDFESEAYQTVAFQNINMSVGVTNNFMMAVENNETWETKFRKPHLAPIDPFTYRAQEILMEAAKCAHQCGDPGIFYLDNVNKWNTCKEDFEIRSSNPCGEFLGCDDSACNLASMNLLKFRNKQGFLLEEFYHTIKIMIIAQDLLVDLGHYPTKAITENSKKYRPLGLGYGNLGALLMAWGIPYDSDEGRATAAMITANMTAVAYETSALIAENVGAYPRFEDNIESHYDVLMKHEQAIKEFDFDNSSRSYLQGEVVERLEHIVKNKRPLRNSQVTLLAPTGTISFAMGFDSTGVEPIVSLVSYKSLAGGGSIKIVPSIISEALVSLGYNSSKIEDLNNYVHEYETLEGSSVLPEELLVFDCAYKSEKNPRCISANGHLDMIASIQPFLSGGISKTIALPNDATPEDIYDIYYQAWVSGLKDISVYRDGSKIAQPIKTSKTIDNEVTTLEYRRKRMPITRPAIIHKFSVGGQEGYLTIGLYENGAPGEIFIECSRTGSTVNGLLDAFATMTSIALQSGVPLGVISGKFKNTRFEPSGITNNDDIRFSKSILDYIFRYLEIQFVSPVTTATKKFTMDEAIAFTRDKIKHSGAFADNDVEEHIPTDEFCRECGERLIRLGSKNCTYCPNGCIEGTCG